MKPSVTAVLAAVSGLIVREVSPALGDTYLSEQLQRSAALLGAAGEEFDRAAARRVQENQALRLIFRQAAPLVASAGGGHESERPAECATGRESGHELARALAEAANGSDLDDLRISRLDVDNHRLRALLIRLQAWAEAAEPTPASAALQAVIWTELRASTERRALSISRA